MLSQLTAVGILQIVVGGAELAFAGVWIVLIVSMAWSTWTAEIQVGGAPVLSVYAVLAILLLSSAVMRIVSGISSFHFKHRILMIVSLIFGFLTVMTCYCSVPALAVGTYGLVVIFNAAVKQAYAMRSSGMSPAEIRDAFKML